MLVCPTGRTTRLRVDVQGKPAFHQVSRFVECDQAGATMARSQLSLDGSPLAEPEVDRVTWRDLQTHASFAADDTTIESEWIETAIGELDCLRYTVRETPTDQVCYGQPVPAGWSGDCLSASGPCLLPALEVTMRHWSVRLALVSRARGRPDRGRRSHRRAPRANRRRSRVARVVPDDWPFLVEVASVCPTDGVTPCAGTVGGRNLTGWTWATAPQVRDLMDDHAPGLATAEPPVVSGIEGFWGAISFLGVMRWTTYTSLTYSYSEWTGGWTASKSAESGLPIAAGAGYSHQLAGTTATGSIGLGAETAGASSVRGVFLWRPAGDYTPPVVTPTVSGTLGNNGWYRSDVSVSWNVTDDESPIVSRQGCDASTLTIDGGAKTFECTATSAGLGGQGRGLSP